MTLTAPVHSRAVKEPGAQSNLVPTYFLGVASRPFEGFAARAHK